MNGHHRNPVICADPVICAVLGGGGMWFIRDRATGELRVPTIHEAACLLWRCWCGSYVDLPKSWYRRRWRTRGWLQVD